MKFKPFETNPLSGGIQMRYKFPNGYGASVIKHDFSYGGKEDKWEIAILKFDGEKSSSDYSTPITSDVLGWQSDEDVENVLAQIEKLPQ